MSERKIAATQDNRYAIMYTETDTSIPRTNCYWTGATAGVVKTTSCWTGGKFVPGVVKLREASFSTRTASFGEGKMGFTRIGGSWKGSQFIVAGRYGAKFDFSRATVEWDPILANLSATKCFAKLQGCEEAVGESLAELPENLRMFHKGISSIKQAIQVARKRGFSWSRAARALRELKSNGRKLKRLPEHLANSWLLWRYGIRPLFWEYMMYCRIINQKIKSSNVSGLQRKSAQVTSDGKTQSISYNNLIVGGCWYDATETRVTKVKSRTVVYYRELMPFGDYDSVLRYYGLHPEQFPSLLWELTPLSFVVDWFSNMGDWVQAITPSVSHEILGWCTSQKVTIHGTRKVTSNVYGSGYNPNIEYFLDSAPTDTLSVESLIRKVGDSRPLMYPWVTPGVMLDIQRWLDIITIALQRAKPRRT